MAGFLSVIRVFLIFVFLRSMVISEIFITFKNLVYLCSDSYINSHTSFLFLSPIPARVQCIFFDVTFLRPCAMLFFLTCASTDQLKLDDIMHSKFPKWRQGSSLEIGLSFLWRAKSHSGSLSILSPLFIFFLKTYRPLLNPVNM